MSVNSHKNKESISIQNGNSCETERQKLKNTITVTNRIQPFLKIKLSFRNGISVTVYMLDVLLMVILADHLEVPSRTLCLMLFMCWAWSILDILNTFRISSKISGLFLSRIFILSFMAMMMCCVRSSAPVFELFSAAPEDNKGGGNRREVMVRFFFAQTPFLCQTSI